jgi:oligopeptide transport system substrate-binding protein
MLSKERYVLAAVVIVCGLLLAGCERIEESLRALGIIAASPEDVEVTTEVEVPVELPAQEEGLSAGCTCNAYRMGWVMDYSDAGNMLNVVFHPDSTFQYTSWDDEGFRELVRRAMMEFDFDTRLALWQQAEDILVTDYAAVIPIFHYDRSVLVKADIEVVFPPFGAPPFKHWRLPEGQATMRVRLSTEPPTLDVNTVADTASYLVLNQVMDALYEYDGEGRIQPAGAVSYEVSDDGLVYTVRLREGATWSDGEPVVAQHYVDGIVRLLKPETAAKYAWMMHLIQGAKSFNAGETSDLSTLGVRVIDDYALEITLEQAASYFDSILALSTTYPVRLDVIERHGGLWTEPGNFVGNGAFSLIEWAHEDYVVVEKNTDYWDADNVTIERIEFPIIADDATALAAYDRGELDYLGSYPPGELPRILEDMPGDFRRGPWPGTYHVGLNVLRSPTDNPNLRKALASAVDKQAILDSVLGTPWRIAACGVIPPEIPGYQGCGNVGYEFDVEAARRYLEVALDEMGMDGPADVSVNLWFNQENEDVAKTIAEQWESNLGIHVNVVIMEWETYLTMLDECDN